MKPAPFVALLAALLVAHPGNASARDGTVLWTAGASFVDHVAVPGTPRGVFSPDARSFQSLSFAGGDTGGLNENCAILLAGLGLLAWLARRRSKALHAPE